MASIAFLFSFKISSLIFLFYSCFLYNHSIFTMTRYFSYFCSSFIFNTINWASFSWSSFCFNLYIYRYFIWFIITYLPFNATILFLSSFYYSSLIFTILYIYINLSFFFYIPLNFYQSHFLYSTCLSRTVAILAYATILFIFFTSSRF